MRKIPEGMKEQILADEYYQKCARKNNECAGRITWEHSFIYAGKQINEVWAIIPLCVYHHLGAGLEKEINQLIALKRATDIDLQKYPRKDWQQLYRYLSNKYA